MRKLSSFHVAFVMLVSLFSISAHARPEYGAQYGINRCTACHFSPAGGGPRNQNGKLFGAFGYKTTHWVQSQDFAGGDFKMLYYRPSRTEQTRNGLGIMEGTVWASIPVVPLSAESSELRVVVDQNLGGYSAGAGPREWYLRWAFSEDTATSWLPQYILLGRIIPAFGLKTDEHRTYTRLASNTAWSTSFDTGVMVSANPVESLHYDLAVVNGQKNNGQSPNSGMADIWGGTANLRWMPLWLPLSIGTSGAWYSAGPSVPGSTTAIPEASAYSAYAQLSFHRMTNNHIPLTISAEAVRGHNWNNSFTTTFVNQTSYAQSVANADSLSFYGLAEWELTRRVTLQYKFDHLLLNENYPSDAYQRHGVGAKHHFGHNLWFLVRVEQTIAARPGEKDGSKTGGLDAVWGVLNLSI